jgi:dihydroorotase
VSAVSAAAAGAGSFNSVGSPAAPVVIRGGSVLAGPLASTSEPVRADVVIVDGVITEIAASITVPSGAIELDASGSVVGPGLVDLHSHLREPGNEGAETVETGSRAAARGGYTAILAMPNTTPAIDSAAVVSQVLALGRAAGLCDVHVAGAITIGRAGEQLAPMAEMADLGVRLFTDDGTGVQNNRLMRRALEYASALGVTLAQHCEDSALSEGGVMHEGAWSSRLGLPGQPSESEELMVMRDIALCRRTGAPVHFLHLSTAGSVALVRAAKADGLPVTAEAAPHHFTLTDACLASYDTVFKVHPPLRTEDDRIAVIAGLADGTIDAIATDHAPHTPEMKERSMLDAPPGMLGLETAASLALSELGLPIARVFSLLSAAPARIAQLTDRHGMLAVGRAANVCVIDPTTTWTVDPARLASRARNTPYAGRTVTGRIRHTVLGGIPTVHNEEATR